MVSSTQRNALRQHLGWFQPAERLSRALVELTRDGVEMGLVVHRQVRALGKYWRSRPLVFSLDPRCQGLWGSQK